MRVTAFAITVIVVLPFHLAAAGTIDFKELQFAPAGAKAKPGEVTIESVGDPTDSPPGILVLGAGYNAITGEVLPGVCVKGGFPNLGFGQSQLGGSLTHRYIGTISDMSANSAASDTDAGFSFTYKLVSIGFGTGSSSERFFNSVDRFARLYVRVATRGEALKGDTWSDLGKTEINKSLKRFTQICGTHYLRAIYHGHILDQTFRFELKSSKFDSASRDSFSLGVEKLFGFNYSDSANQQAVAEASKMTISDDSRGLLTVIPATPDSPAGVSALVKFAREDYTNAILAASPDKASPVLVELVPYYQLPATGSDKVPTWPDEIMVQTSARTAIYQNFLTALSDLNFASNLSAADAAKIYNDAPADIVTKQTNALAIQTDYRNAVRTCFDLLGKPVDDEAARKKCLSDLDVALNPTKIQSIRLSLK